MLLMLSLPGFPVTSFPSGGNCFFVVSFNLGKILSNICGCFDRPFGGYFLKGLRMKGFPPRWFDSDLTLEVTFSTFDFGSSLNHP